MPKDPVCGMEVEQQAAVATREIEGTVYYFCSDSCTQKFDADPGVYLQGEQRAEASVIGSATTGVNPQLSGPVRVELPIVNLECATCARTIESALKELDGVKNATVNFATARAHVEYDQTRVSLADMDRTVRQAGYTMGGADAQIGIQDLRCASCVTLIEDTLKEVPGVLGASVNVAAQQANIGYLPGMTTPANLVQAIESTGYRTVKPPPETTAEDAEQASRQAEYRKLRNRFVFSGVLAAIILTGTFGEFIPVLQAVPQSINWIILFIFVDSRR